MPERSEFRIIRSLRRKKIAFRAGRDGIIEILAPQNVPETFLHRIFQQESALIAKIRAATALRQKIDLSGGAEFWLLGRKFPLRLTGRVMLFDHAFLIPDGSEKSKLAALTALYKNLARMIIGEKVKKFAPLCRVFPEKININSAATRWGSCSGKKTLSFTWKLVQCPEELIDYVVVHELCHLKEMNHSPRFWAEVSAVMPDHARRRAELKKFARALPDWD